MALDAAVHPQDYSMGYFCKEFFNFGGGGFDLQEQKGFLKLLGGGGGGGGMEHCILQNVEEWDPKSSPEVCGGDNKVRFSEGPPSSAAMEDSRAATVGGKRKRQRTRACKNKKELENQRMTHIAVERNRRKQMNDYLAVIRSLMPPSYVQRGDQASIIGGAINFVKELEQHLQSLEAQKRTSNIDDDDDDEDEQKPGENRPIFADFFAFPQYSTTTESNSNSNNEPKKKSAIADIEVSMAESHANLKILSKKRPRQLLKLVSGLQCLWFTILHLNVTTTFDQRVLYCISVKLEEGCRLTTVDEIAEAVNHLLGRIEEDHQGV